MHMDSKQLYYHGVLKNHKIVEFLLESQEIGGFLFWRISKNQADYLLTLKESHEGFAHYIVPSMTIQDLQGLVQYYRTHALDCCSHIVRLGKGLPVTKKRSTKLKTFEQHNLYQHSIRCVSKTDTTNQSLALDHSRSNEVDVTPTGCRIIRNEGFDDEYFEDSNPKLDGRLFSSILSNNNEDMKLPRGDSRCRVFLENAFMKSKTNLSFVRGILRNWKRRSTSCSTDSEVDGYCAFPIDDDIFDVSSGESASNDVFVFDSSCKKEMKLTTRTYALNQTNSTLNKNSETDAPCRESVTESPEQNLNSVKYRTKPLKARQDFSPMQHRPMSCIASFQSPETEEKRIINTNRNVIETRNSPDHYYQSPKRKSYYVAGDDIAPDSEILDTLKLSSNNNISPSSEDSTSTPSNGSGLFHSPSRLSNFQVYEAWSEVGREGGVVQIPGTGTSIHFFPKLKLNDAEKRLLKQTSMSTLDLQSTIKNGARSTTVDDAIDGRVFIGLEDPPDHLNNNTRIVAGPMVRVDYASYDIISSGAVLQIDVNTSLKRTLQNESNGCEFFCLRSESADGIFEEIVGSYYQYGNTLQVTISSDLIGDLGNNTGEGGSMFLVPVAKLSVQRCQDAQSFSIWNRISTKVFWVGIYGPKRPYRVSTCCVSMSSSSTSPPTLWIKRNSSEILLHLWASYRIGVYEPQDIRVFIQPEPSSSATVTSYPNMGDNSVILEEEIRTKSRINRLFTLKYPKEEKRPLRERNFSESDTSPSRSCEKPRDKFTLNMVSLHDEVHNEMRFMTPKRVASCSTPVKRWKKNICSAPPKSIQDGDGHDYLYLWHDAQRDAKTKLRPTFQIPGAKKLIPITRVAVAIASRTRSKSQATVTPHLVQYMQSDILPILSRDTLWAHGTNQYKQWLVGVSHGKVGLIHTKCVRLFDTDQCYEGVDGRITVFELIENIIEPVESLKYNYATLREQLITKLNNWKLFSSILQFGENYMDRICSEAINDSKRETQDKLSLFLDKYKEYCSTGACKRSFKKEVIRALLYMKQCDLAELLIADFCLLTVSSEIGERWNELALILEGKDGSTSINDVKDRKWRSRSLPGKKFERKPTVNSSCTENENLVKQDSSKQAFNYLSAWRQGFKNHRTSLLNLHQAIDKLPESPNQTSKYFTLALILIFSIESLRKLSSE